MLELTACVDKEGYGRFVVWNRRIKSAHRVSWMLNRGEIPEDLCVLHICIANRRCVNPRHLYIGTQQDNMDDKVNQGRVPNGEDHSGAKLTDADVAEIREKYKPYKYTLQMLADEYGVSLMNIQLIVNYKTRKNKA